MNGRIMTECHYSEVEGRSSHFHNTYEILFVRQGHVRIRVSNNEYHVGPNTLVFFSNLEEHVTQVEEYPFCRYFVKLDPELLSRKLGSMWQISILKNRPQNFIHWVNVDRYAETVDALFRMLLDEYRCGDEYSDEMVISIVRQILVYTSRSAPERFAQVNRQQLQNCAKVQRWIEQHFTEEVRIRDISESLYVNAAQLSRDFKKATGYTTKQYLMLNRITYAKDLLVHTDMSIGEICSRCGFMDTSNFVRYFKREMGATPGGYRKENGQFL